MGSHSFRIGKWKWSRSVVSDSATPWTLAHQALPSMGFSRQEYGVCCHFLLQRIFPTQGSNPVLPHCRQKLYHLSHQGSLSSAVGGLNSKGFDIQRGRSLNGSPSWELSLVSPGPLETLQGRSVCMGVDVQSWWSLLKTASMTQILAM